MRFHAASLTLILTVACFGASPVESTFDTGLDGWTCTGDPSSGMSWVPSGGNPGGALHYWEAGGNLVDFLLAPPKFLGDKSSFYGGYLSIDLADSSPRAASAIWLRTEGVGWLQSTPILPTMSFTAYTFPLTEGNWTVGDGPFATQSQIVSFLGALTQIRILADYDSSHSESVLIDNVRLVPEPGIAVLLALGGVLLKRRRPRR